MEPDSQAQGSGPPLVHPKASGLEAVVRTTVREELARQGGGGNGGNGGGFEKRISAIETRLGTIEKTMVTGEVLQKELGLLRGEINKIPLETIKWFFAFAAIIAAIFFGTYQAFWKH